MWSYSITAPENYTVFTGDIEVSYNIPTGIVLSEGLIELVSDQTKEVIRAVNMPSGFNEGILTFRCGLVDQTGAYHFRMVREKGGPVLTETNLMQARWPRFLLSLPDDHKALTNEVSLQFTTRSSHTLCSPTQPGAVFQLELIYYGKADDSKEVDLATLEKTVVDTQQIESFETAMTSYSYVFPCYLFDQAGLYEVHFTTQYQSGIPIATSNPMPVTWGKAYTLSGISPSISSIFPGCDRYGYFTIVYSQPVCSGEEDKIRLYKQRHLSASPAAPTNLDYIGEQRARKGGSSVAFGCNLFHETVPGYCFKYVSIARNGAVNEQVTICIPTTDDIGQFSYFSLL